MFKRALRMQHCKFANCLYSAIETTSQYLSRLLQLPRATIVSTCASSTATRASSAFTCACSGGCGCASTYAFQHARREAVDVRSKFRHASETRQADIMHVTSIAGRHLPCKPVPRDQRRASR